MPGISKIMHCRILINMPLPICGLAIPIAYNYVFHCHTISLFLVLDSWGRPEAGLLTGVTNWIGDYGECTSSKSISQDSPSQFQGKYCTGMHPTSVPVNGQVSVL